MRPLAERAGPQRMRQLNFDLKTLQARHRDGAFITRRDRAYALDQAADLLHALGFQRPRAALGAGPRRARLDAVFSGASNGSRQRTA